MIKGAWCLYSDTVYKGTYFIVIYRYALNLSLVPSGIAAAPIKTHIKTCQYDITVVLIMYCWKSYRKTISRCECLESNMLSTNGCYNYVHIMPVELKCAKLYTNHNN